MAKTAPQLLHEKSELRPEQIRPRAWSGLRFTSLVPASEDIKQRPLRPLSGDG